MSSVGLVVQNAVRQDGQGRAMLELARALATRGHDVTLYCHHADPAIAGAVRLRRIPRAPGPQLADDLWLLARAGAAVQGAGHDVVCGLGPTVRWQGPSVYYAQFSHGGWRRSWSPATRPGPYHRAHARALERLERSCVRHADAVIALSGALGDEITAGASTPVTVVPNGIDVDEFAPVSAAERAAARHAFSLDPAAAVVGFVGDFQTPRKGLEPLVEAIGSTPAHLVVAGKGDARRVTMQARRAGAGERVQVVGFRPARQVMAAADVVAVPSSYEPFSLVALEAAASALPVVVSARAGAAPLLGDGAVVVGDPENPRDLAAALREVLDLPESARSAMGQQGRSAATTLAWTATAGSAADVVETVAAPRVRARG